MERTVRWDEDQLRAEAQRRNGRHGGSDAESPDRIAGGRNNAAWGGPPTATGFPANDGSASTGGEANMASISPNRICRGQRADMKP